MFLCCGGGCDVLCVLCCGIWFDFVLFHLGGTCGWGGWHVIRGQLSQQIIQKRRPNERRQQTKKETNNTTTTTTTTTTTQTMNERKNEQKQTNQNQKKNDWSVIWTHAPEGSRFLIYLVNHFDIQPCRERFELKSNIYHRCNEACDGHCAWFYCFLAKTHPILTQINYHCTNHNTCDRPHHLMRSYSQYQVIIGGENGQMWFGSSSYQSCQNMIYPRHTMIWWLSRGCPDHSVMGGGVYCPSKFPTLSSFVDSLFFIRSRLDLWSIFHFSVSTHFPPPPCHASVVIISYGTITRTN